MAFPLPDKPSVAVLPFDNMSDDPAQEHFVDGMTDDLITDLSKVSGLFVIARNSTFVYKNQPVEIRRVAEALGVRYVVEGSVRRAGDTVRVNAQLIDATTGGHVWAERYDGEVADIFRVQDEFVRKIVEALQISLAPQEARQISQGQTNQIAARNAFQKGWELYLRFNAEDNAKAVSHLKKAVELDPEYGRAFAVLSLAYLRSAKHFSWGAALGLGNWDAYQAALRYLEQARKYPTALVHVFLSLDHLYSGRQEKAFNEAARAISLDPNEPEAHVVMAWVMITQGKPDAGRHQVDPAVVPQVRPQCRPASASRARLNLGNFMRTPALPDAVEQWSLTTLREKLIKIGAKIVRRGRYVTFQMAEVAIPRALFADILRRIDRLRPKPAPA